MKTIYPDSPIYTYNEWIRYIREQLLPSVEKNIEKKTSLTIAVRN